MKLNVSFPQNGSQKLIEIDDEKKVRHFYEKRMGQEVQADPLGEEWKGYIFRIGGGNDKQGFPMKQGVLTNNRVRLLLSKGDSCYRQRRTGERKRKSVRGCIVDANLSVLALIIMKKGEAEIPGLTDKTVPRRLGPKRANNIRKLFNLDKEDDVRRYVIKRPLPLKEGKKQRYKAPKIQRLITPQSTLHRKQKKTIKIKRRERAIESKAEYAKLLAKRRKEAMARKSHSSRRSSMRESIRTSEGSGPTKKKASKKAKEVVKGGKAAPKEKPTIKEAGKVSAKAAAKVAATKQKQTKPEAKKVEKKKFEKKTDGKKTDGKKTDGKKTDGKKTDGKKTDGKKTEVKKTAAPKAESKPQPQKKTKEPKKPVPAKTEGKKTIPPKTETKPQQKKPAAPKPAAQKKEAPKPAAATTAKKPKPKSAAKPKK